MLSGMNRRAGRQQERPGTWTYNRAIVAQRHIIVKSKSELYDSWREECSSVTLRQGRVPDVCVCVCDRWYRTVVLHSLAIFFVKYSPKHSFPQARSTLPTAATKNPRHTWYYVVSLEKLKNWENFACFAKAVSLGRIHRNWLVWGRSAYARACKYFGPMSTMHPHEWVDKNRSELPNRVSPTSQQLTPHTTRKRGGALEPGMDKSWNRVLTKEAGTGY
jgi:hypothetical protein